MLSATSWAEPSVTYLYNERLRENKPSSYSCNYSIVLRNGGFFLFSLN